MAEIYLELVPEHYDGDFPAVTIKHKPSQKDDVVRLESYIIEALDRFDKEQRYGLQ